MTDTIRIKRRLAAGGAGAPASLANAEIAYNEASNILYYGVGGTPTLAASVSAIGGPGAFLPLSGGTMTGSLVIGSGANLNFGSVTVATATDLSQHIALYGTTYGFSITSGTMNLVANGVATLNSTSSLVTFPRPVTFNAGGTSGAPLIINGNIGNVYPYPTTISPLGAMGWNVSSGQGEVDFFNCYVTNGGFRWYQQVTATCPSPWVASTAYAINALVQNNGNTYLCTVAGTSAASGGPSGTGTGIVDGSVTWNYQFATGGASGYFNQFMELRGNGGAGALAIGVPTKNNFLVITPGSTQATAISFAQGAGGTGGFSFTAASTFTAATTFSAGVTCSTTLGVTGIATLGANSTVPNVTPASDNSTKIANTAFVQSAIAAAPVTVTSFNTRTGAVTLSTADVTGAGGAPAASPTFTGTAMLAAMTVSGATTLSGTVTANNTATFTSGLSVSGATLTVGTNATAQWTVINGAAGQNRGFLYQTAGLNRWFMATTTAAESGSNAGTDFIVISYNDAGTTQLAQALTITRATGLVTLWGDPTANLGAATKQYVDNKGSATAPIMDGTAAAGSATTFSRSDHVHPSDTSRLALAGGTMTGNLIINPGNLQMGSVFAASATDLSQHIAIYSTTYGINAQSNVVNVVVAGVASFSVLNTGASVAGTLAATGVTTLGPAAGNRLTITGGAAAANPIVFNQTGTGGYTITGNLTITGTPTGPTATAGTNTTQLATCQFVQSGYLPLVGGSLSGNLTITAGGLTVSGGGVTTLGTATATTVAPGDNSTNIATTAFVASAVATGGGAYLPLAGGSLTGGLGFGSTTAPGGVNDLSRHIALWGTTYGFNVTGNSLNYNAPGTAAHNFYLGTNVAGNIGANAALLGSGTGTQTVAICGAAGFGRWLEWRSGTTGATMRWRFATTATAESGSNVGSDFQLIRGSDTGTSLGTPITITRSTGAMTIGEAIGTVTFPGPVYIANQLVAFGGEADEIPLNSNLGSAAYADLNNHILANYVFTHNAAYQVLSTDWTNLLLMTTGTNTWTLPAASDVNTGWWAYFKNRATTNLTIALTGTDTLNGVAASQVIPGGTSGRLFKSGTGTYESIVIPGQSTTTPLMDGTAAIGTSLTYAAADHVHPSDTSRFAIAGGTVTGATTFSAAVTHNSQINFGSSTVATATDLSRHIALFGTQYGFSITSGTLNIVAAGTNPMSMASNQVNINAAASLALMSATTSSGGIQWRTTGNGTDQNIWDATVSGTSFVMRAVNDAYSAANSWVQVIRSGYGISNINFNASSIAMSGGTTTFNGPAVVQNNSLYVQTNSGWATICMTKSASGQGNQILGYTGTNAASGTRWNITLGDNGAETGSNAGSNFAIYRYTDTGAYIDSPLSINRATGTVFFNNAVLWTTDSIFGFTISGAYRYISFANTGGGSNSYQYDTSGLALYTWINGRNLWAMRNSDALVWNPTGTVGGNGAYANISDRRIKANIELAKEGLDEVLRLNPVRFNRIQPDGEISPLHEIGFIAQDVIEVLPEAVKVIGTQLPDDLPEGYHKPNRIDSDDEPLLGVTNDAIIASVVNAIKELNAKISSPDKIAALEATIEKLSAKIATLETTVATIH